MDFPFQLPTDREFDVVGFGTNAVDFLIRVPEYPAFDSKIELDDYVQAAGGEIASTMAGLRRLGYRTAYAGRFGDDSSGAFGIASLVEDGVDVAYAETMIGAATQIAFIVIDSRNGERTVIWKRDKALSYSAGEAPVDLADKCRILHFTPHDTAAAQRMAEAARNSGAVVSIDIDRAYEGVEQLLPLVDILITSADFPPKFTGSNDLRDSLRKMAATYGCPIVGSTLGEAGSLILVGSEFVETAGYAVPGGCQDTTGAGDAFRVGLLSGILDGISVEEAAMRANAVAALKCRQIGARTSLPSRTELDALIKKV